MEELNDNPKIAFGLEAQGHIETIERLLTKWGKNYHAWIDIGAAIGWDPLTACINYREYQLNRDYPKPNKESNNSGADPAFPSATDLQTETMLNNSHDPSGISKRYYTACIAMQGLITNCPMGNLHNSTQGVQLAYQWADELLKQENE